MQNKTKEQLLSELGRLHQSEQQYRRLLDEMNTGYAITRLDQILYANRALADMLDHSVDELVGRSWKEFVESDIADYIDRTPMTNLPSVLITQFRRPDGQEIFLELAIRSTTYNGELAEFALVRDITERVQMITRLQESEERFRNIFQNSPIGLYRTTPDGQILMANPALVQMLGYTSTQELGQRNLEQTGFHPNHPRSRFKKRIEATGQVIGLESAWTKKDGSILFVRENARAIRDRHNQTKYYEGSVEDITERKLAEHKVRRRNRELALLNRVITATTSTLDPQEALQIACRELAETFGIPQAIAAIFQNNDSQLAISAAHLTSNHPSILNKSIPVAGTRLIARIKEHKESIYISEVPSDPRLSCAHELIKEYHTVSLLLLPILLSQAKVAGIIALGDTEPRDFDPEEVTLAQNATAAVAQALETTRLYETLRNRTKQLQILRAIDQATVKAHSLQEISHIALDHLRRLVPCQRASILVFDYEKGHATVLNADLDGPTTMQPSSTIPLSDYDISDAMRASEIILVNDTQTSQVDPPIIQKLNLEGIRSYIIVPLVAHAQLCGALYLGASQPQALFLEHIEHLKEFVAQLALAVEQAQLRQEIQEHTNQLEILLKERTAKLQDALEEAQSANYIKSQFVANVSHELRTPLTNLKLYTNLISRGNPEKRATYLDTLRRETDRLEKLIEGILDLSQIDLGKANISLQPTDLNTLIRILATDRATMATAKNLTLHTALNEPLPLVAADPKLLERVFTNLLTNAINYTPAGGHIYLSTELAHRGEEQWVTATVYDTGPGILPEEQPLLFERFHRGIAGRTSNLPGTGLGLAISKEIIDQHQGHITVDSEPGQGSKFTIWLQPAQNKSDHSS